MIMTLALFAAAQAAQIDEPSAAPQEPLLTVEPIPLPIEQETALRCSAAIAIATERQRMGQERPEGWPDLLENERGREFFVRSMAKLIDDTGLTRTALAFHGRKQAEALMAEPGRLEQIMPACFLLLEASGL